MQSKWILWLIAALCGLLGFTMILSEDFTLGKGLFGIGLMFVAIMLSNIVRAKNIEEEAFNKVKKEVDRLGYPPDESMEIAKDTFRILKSGPGADFSYGLDGTLGETIEAPLKNIKGTNYTPSDLKAAIELALMSHRRRE